MSSNERLERLRPLEALELSLVRASLESSGALRGDQEAALRWILALARVDQVGSGSQTVDLNEELASFRVKVRGSFGPLLDGRPDLEAAAALAGPFLLEAKALRASILRNHPALSPQALDREIAEKKLVLALGGGGGTGYVYLGVFALLEEWGLRPDLISATSMGAILGLFRARRPDYDPGEILGAVRGLSFRRLFRLLSTESRYGLPAALRLYLRGSLSRHAQHEDGSPFTFRDLPIPLLVTVSGIRRGKLPRPITYYEKLIEPTGLALRPWLVGSKLEEVAHATSELSSPGALEGIHLGLDDWTRDFDVVDAVGFSSAVPGLIHYDVLRQDPRMHDLLGTLFEQRDLFRLVDGGLTENVPAQAAWQATQDGRLGSRNTLILALDGFSPKLRTPLWLPLQRIAAENVRKTRHYAHLSRSFPRTPSPTALLPSVPVVARAILRGRDGLLPDLPLLRRMLQPLPPIESLDLANGPYFQPKFGRIASAH